MFEDDEDDFEAWLAVLDDFCFKKAGVSYEDLPDYAWKDLYGRYFQMLWMKKSAGVS